MNPGDRVRLMDNPSRIGVLTSYPPTGEGRRRRLVVMFPDSAEPILASSLEPVEAGTSDPYPDTYRSYVNGVEVSFEGGAKTPDERFYQGVRNQVAGKVLYGAWKQKLLTQEAVRGTTFFLCGRAGRHSFYAALKSRLQKTDGCTWLNAKPRELALPTNISAPGVVHSDYDRLSVAYGLSQLNPGSFERVAALKPKVSEVEEMAWTTLAVDKSVC